METFPTPWSPALVAIDLEAGGAARVSLSCGMATATDLRAGKGVPQVPCAYRTIAASLRKWGARWKQREGDLGRESGRESFKAFRDETRAFLGA